jgi:hypothetical protein
MQLTDELESLDASSVWGISEDGHKQTGCDPGVMPCLVIHDPDLTLVRGGAMVLR